MIWRAPLAAAVAGAVLGGLVMVATGVVGGSSDSPKPSASSTPPLIAQAQISGSVGYHKDSSGLRTLDSRHMAAMPAGCTWVPSGLRCLSSEPVTLDHLYVKGSVDYYGQAHLSIVDSVVSGPVIWHSIRGQLNCAVIVVRSTFQFIVAPTKADSSYLCVRA